MSPDDLELGPVPRQRPRVLEAEATAMAVQFELGKTTTDLAREFGYDPRTVRAAIRAVPVETRRQIGMVVAQELAGLNLSVARKALAAILSRDLNRPLTTADGTEIPGEYRLPEGVLVKIAEISAKVVDLMRGPAGLGSDKEAGQGAMNPLAALFQNEDALKRVTRTLAPGERLKIDLSQSVELSGGDSGSASLSPATAAWSESSDEDAGP